MNFKLVLKIAALALISSVASADDIDMKGDCKEIYDFFDENNVASSLYQCLVDNNGKVITVGFDNYYITESAAKKALSYDTITKLSYTKVGSTPYHVPEFGKFPPQIADLKNLEEFTFNFIGFKDYVKTGIPDGALKFPKTLKKLTISGFTAQQCNIDDISTLTNLEVLELKYFNRPAETIDFEPLKTLNKLKTLTLYNEAYVRLDDLPEAVYSSSKTITNITITGHTLNKISDRISNLSKLKHLDLNTNDIETIFEKLKNLKNLEYLDLRRNKISEEIPEFFNDFKNLKYFDVSDNINISGKTLTNTNLETCNYDNKYQELCMASKDMKCLKNKNYSFEECEKETDLPIHPDGRCGEGLGRCKEGQCCSKFGWCGTSDLHCVVAEGCQSKYGNCLKI